MKMTNGKGDPRSKIVVNAPPLRKCMGEKRFDVVVGEAVMGSKFELNIQGGFFNWSALKMTKYKEKLKYLNWSANCSSQKVLSVKPQ